MKTNQQAANLKTTTLADLLDRQFPPRAVLIAPWLRSAESCLLWAPTGVGKSLLVNTLALAVAGGGSVAGWKAERPRKVVLIDGEMHIEDLRERLAMLAATVDGIDMEAAGRNLVILSRQDQSPYARFPDLAEATAPNPATKAGQDVIMEKVCECSAELVILDNFSTLAEVADENEAAAMSPILSFLMRLKQANVACILVHHAGKAGNDYRGSSKLATTFEVIMGLVRPDGQAATDGAVFELLWKKYRGRPTTATRDAEMRLETDSEGAAKWTTKPAAGAEMMTVVDAIRSCQYRTQRALAEALGMTPVQVGRLKAKAIGQGVMTKSEWDVCLTGVDEEHSDF
jgi:hypothetical protein